jgi:hypothetical protein
MTMEGGMQIDIKIGDMEFRATVWGLALFMVVSWMLFTYGEPFLDGFIGGLTGQPPR